MYAYAANNPVKYVDPDGNSLTLAFSWLPVVDGPLPIGDITLGILFVIDLTLAKNAINNIQEQQEIKKTLERIEQEEKKENLEAKSNGNNKAGASAGVPSPDPDDGNNSNEDYYESNPKHHKNAKGKASEEPKNAKEMFDKSVEDPSKPNTRWYKDKNGNFHRFQGSNHKYHWNGSTDTGTRLDNVPIEIRRNLPLGDI